MEERATARGTALVKLDIGYCAVADEDGLDVLTADVEDERDGRIYVVCGFEVRHGLDDAVVEIEGRLDEILTVACDGGATESGCRAALGYERRECAESLLYFFERVAVVVGIALEEDATLRIGDDKLGCRGARIDAEEDVVVGALLNVSVLQGFDLQVAEPLLILSLVGE